MNAKRAQEIMNSPVMANVSYNGSRVYIEHVDQTTNMATVHPLSSPNSKQSVNVSSLQEQ